MSTFNRKPFKKTATKKDFIEALWKSAGLVTIACEESGYSYHKYKKELENDEEFQSEVEFIKQKISDVAEAELFQLIQNGYDKAIFFYLKHKAKDRGYGESLDINHKHQMEQPLLAPLDDSKPSRYILPSPEEDNGSTPPKNDPESK